MGTKIAVFFSGFVNIVIGTSILQSGMKGTFEGKDRYFLGIGIIILGLLCILDLWFQYKKYKENSVEVKDNA